MSTITESSSSSSDTFDQSEEDKSSIELSTSLIWQDDSYHSSKEEEKQQLEDTKERKRTTKLRLNLISNRNRSKSSSPSIHRPCKSLNFLDDFSEGSKFQRSLSCRPPHDHLELEELQGFMDLGFHFEKDQVTPRTMSMIPGLQRLGGYESNFNESYATLEGKEGETEEEKTKVWRPYLSEAWLVKRPNSPLLRLRMARVNTSEDMKKCLKLWARTVASSIQANDK